MYNNWAEAHDLNVEFPELIFTCLLKARNGFAYLGGHNPDTHELTIYVVPHDFYEISRNRGDLDILLAGDEAYVSPEEDFIQSLTRFFEVEQRAEDLLAEEGATLESVRSELADDIEALEVDCFEETKRRRAPQDIVADFSTVATVMVCIKSEGRSEREIISDIQENFVFSRGRPNFKAAVQCAVLQAIGIEGAHAEIASKDDRMAWEYIQGHALASFVYTNSAHIDRAIDRHTELAIAEEDQLSGGPSVAC